MNTGIPRPCCFIYIIDGAWGRENMFEALEIARQKVVLY
jgi:hypothetical protein